MTIYIVVEEGWDHHVNMGVFDAHDLALDYKWFLEEKSVGYDYDIEEMQLNATPV